MSQKLQIDGFKKWDSYYQFAKDKYSDVSVAIAGKDFEMSKRTLRELIDNTCPYHSQGIKVKNTNEAGEEIFVVYTYEDYFELVVDKFETMKSKEDKRDLTPDEKNEIFETFDFFYQQVRLIRRLIMKDISNAGIIPTAEIKKDPKINPLLTGDIENES